MCFLLPIDIAEVAETEGDIFGSDDDDDESEGYLDANDDTGSQATRVSKASSSGAAVTFVVHPDGSFEKR